MRRCVDRDCLIGPTFRLEAYFRTPKVSNSYRGKTWYVQSARLNGKSLERAWITRSEITGVRAATKLQMGKFGESAFRCAFFGVARIHEPASFIPGKGIG